MQIGTEVKDVRIRVNRIFFHAENSGYTVFSFHGFGKENYTAVGSFPSLEKNDVIRASGTIVMHEKYGEQLSISSYYNDLPVSKDEILAFLENGMIRGIGKTHARNIVNKFGSKTLDVIENTPGRLMSIKGIGKVKAASIHREMMKKKEMQNTMVFLAGAGISPAYCIKIYNRFGEKTRSIINKNPYLLTQVNGIGFRKADEIAMGLGFEKDSESRLQAGIEYVLKSTTDGHTYYPVSYLISQASEELQYNDYDKLHKIASSMQSLAFLNRNNIPSVYLKPVYKQEQDIAFMFCALIKETQQKCITEEQIKNLERAAGIELHETQREAIFCSIQNQLMVLTGGPGTGKTATTGIIIRALKSLHLKIALCAPTGRAAKRMSESCHMDASTIHRLLSFNPAENKFIYNANNPLPYHAVLVDESSMIDQPLMYSLLCALRPGTKLILIGDENQLPSVGPGNILADLIHSGICPVIRLTKIFRQKEESEIVLNAHHILNNEPLHVSNRKDFFFIGCEDTMLTQEKVIRYVKKELPAVTGEKEIQVLAPMRRGETGVNKLNLLLQETLNPQGEDHYGFRIGDRVIQMRNNYDLERMNENDAQTGVFNGDIGVITGYYEDDDDSDKDYWTIFMDDGYTVEYPVKSRDDLSLAYAITIHKSQGSEYPVVVIPVTQYIPEFTTMNLIYTAITRAKKYVCVVGSKRVFFNMLRDRKRKYRYTGLCEELQKYKKKEK